MKANLFKIGVSKVTNTVWKGSQDAFSCRDLSGWQRRRRSKGERRFHEEGNGKENEGSTGAVKAQHLVGLDFLPRASIVSHFESIVSAANRNPILFFLTLDTDFFFDGRSRGKRIVSERASEGIVRIDELGGSKNLISRRRPHKKSSSARLSKGEKKKKT